MFFFLLFLLIHSFIPGDGRACYVVFYGGLVLRQQAEFTIASRPFRTTEQVPPLMGLCVFTVSVVPEVFVFLESRPTASVLTLCFNIWCCPFNFNSLFFLQGTFGFRVRLSAQRRGTVRRIHVYSLSSA